MWSPGSGKRRGSCIDKPFKPLDHAIVVLEAGEHIYSRSNNPTDYTEASRSPRWFAFEEGYGSADTYGPHVYRHTLKRNLRLLDVAKTKVRKEVGEYADAMLERTWGCKGQTGEEVLNNAWGEGCNTPAAELVCAVCSALGYDGWIAKDWDDPDMEGPEEIMLCRPEAALRGSKMLFTEDGKEY